MFKRFVNTHIGAISDKAGNVSMRMYSDKEYACCNDAIIITAEDKKHDS
ncbi:MAG: hypothetical protein M3297_14850 [Thermoproteota archaeon]|nr:hypothetical protein [Thermoproteota archaeon]